MGSFIEERNLALVYVSSQFVNASVVTVVLNVKPFTIFENHVYTSKKNLMFAQKYVTFSLEILGNTIG